MRPSETLTTDLTLILSIRLLRKPSSMPKFPFYQQLDQMDCGPTCLRMIAKHHGRNLNLQKLRDASGFSREGVSLLGIAEAAESVGFRTLAVKVPFEKLIKDAPLPCIIHWQQNHFVVLVEAKKGFVLLADPAKGLRKMSELIFVSIGRLHKKIVNPLVLHF